MLKIIPELLSVFQKGTMVYRCFAGNFKCKKLQIKMVLLHSNMLNVKHFPGCFNENMHNVQQNKTFEWNCTLYMFYNSLDMTAKPLLDMVMMAHACSLAGRFLLHTLFCIALTVVTSCTIYFSFGWMWLEFHWPLEHGTCPHAAGGQTPSS